ncbi:TniB family NTP-binding protein [Shewanella mangrovisoli]|uniref:TniB family NTP-binding protein n=1 Tax=Shewanella mangrovisoli TaxID=2864211 RepID=UPI0035B84878
MRHIKKLPVTVAKARYSTPILPEHQGNPLILALPPCLDAKTVSSVLTISVPSPDCASMAKSDQLDAVKKIRQTRIISHQHAELYSEIHQLLRYGYVHRNPSTPEVLAWSYDIADPSVNREELIQPQLINGTRPTTADSIFLTGFSGNGKSTMVEHILSNLFPMVIEHDYNGFNDPQVVYLKVDMPHNSSRAGLIYNMIRELDRVLSATNYGDPEYRRIVKSKSGKYLPVESMMDTLVTVLNRHHVGLIVIDEFQNIAVASKRYRQEVIQLFDELANDLYIPSIKIGTPDTILIFDRNSRHKRRLGRPIELMRFTEKPVWERAMKALFAFQPVPKPIVRNAEIEELLYKLTAGVPAYLLGTWEAVLIEVINSKADCISVSLIKRAFRKKFPLLRSATRNINAGRKGRHSDLLTVQQYLDMDQSTMALKHLESFAQDSSLAGAAAGDVLNDIADSIEIESLSASDLNRLNRIKTRLEEKRNLQLPAQTIEHKS